MIYDELNIQSQIYSHKLDRFFKPLRLPLSWFEHGFDHIAIKAFNLSDYEELIDHYKDHSQYIYESNQDGRHISAIRLLGHIGLKLALPTVGSETKVLDIELMLARPQDQSAEKPRLDHSEIYVEQGLIPVRNVLNRKGVRYYDEPGSSPSWVSVVFEDGEQEVRFTDMHLSDIAKENVRKDIGRVIHTLSYEDI